jgi:hypothetical protein
MENSFSWFSPLGISVALFLAIGALWIVIGALTVPLHDSSIGNKTIFVSQSTDSAYFGVPPSELLNSNAAIPKLRTLLLTVIAGFLLLSGSVFIFVAWFGIKTAQPWALSTLGIGSGLAIFMWVLALRPYFSAGIPITLGDLPPFMWIPAVLILPATILGWIGIS